MWTGPKSLRTIATLVNYTCKSVIKSTPGLNQSVCTWYYFVVSVINVTAKEVKIKNEYQIEVGHGGHAAIGPHSALHVGQSAVTNGLVYDLIISLWHVYFNLLGWITEETIWGTSDVFGKIQSLDVPHETESLVTVQYTTIPRWGGD